MQDGMDSTATSKGGHRARARPHASHRWETAYGYARDFLDNQFVYVVISPRARGLSIGINMNPDRACNFDCVYCEVDRSSPPRAQELDIPVMVEELRQTLTLAHTGRLRERPGMGNLPDELLYPRHVALSGDGEPTLCPRFCEAIEALAHLRALGNIPYFKIVLVSNASGLDRPEVQRGLHALAHQDELWLKLDAGTESWFRQINRPQVPYRRILSNILLTARNRPVVIQSLFPRFNGLEPDDAEIQAYVRRLRYLVQNGAQITLVQVYSAMRPTMLSHCGHLPLRSLSRIAQAVRQGTGLRVEVY